MKLQNPLNLRCILACFMALFAFSVPLANAEVSVGDPFEKVVQELGVPDSDMNAGKVRMLSYDGVRYRLVNDVVAKIDRPKHYVIDDSAELRLNKASRKAVPVAKKAIEIRRNGAAENIQELIVPGKITIIDFFADWCGPCKKISPKLLKLAEDNPDVYIRKVDIVNWKTPIVKQLGIRSIPLVYVFGKSGQQMGPGTSNFAQVVDMIEKSSR